MEKKTVLLIIFIGLLIVLNSQFIHAAIDSPHNEANSVSCGSCHGEGLLQSFWGGSGLYSAVDELCLSCHKRPFGPYTDDDAPVAKTHSSDNTSNKYGQWSRECKDCHDPHYQKQKNYKNTDTSALYLATGTITSCAYNGDGTSTLTYATITYKTGWDATKLTEKTDEYRRTVIFPNVSKLGYSYPITGIDEGAHEITVKGDARPVYQYISSSTFAAMYGQYVKDFIDLGGVSKKVKFFDNQGGPGSFAYDESGTGTDPNPDGVCQVCHTQTNYYRNDGSLSAHYAAQKCSSCHSHTGGFSHGGGGGAGCEDCHGHENDWTGGPYYGTTVSHSTHTENDADDIKGPYIACSDCHNISNFPEFSDGNKLSTTDVCDACHSPDGSFNGVDSVGNSIGAKDYWIDAIYLDLSSKEKWCAGCHDDVPAVVNTNTAPDIVGDNATYGYYLNAHGNGTYGVKRTGVSYPKGECLHCHDVTKTRASHKVPLFADLDDPDFCMECHTDTGSVQEGGISGGPGNIETVFGKTYRHDVTAYSGIHKFSPENETRAYLSANKHVECNDCHNPHDSERGLHASNEVHIAARTNLISDSGPLNGALGIEPTWSASNWGGTSSWPSTSSTATKEYQICFKCHSNYNTNYASWGGTDTASWTNVALEFNPKNQSYHPVVQSLPEIDPGYVYWDPGYSDSYGSNRLPPAFTSLLIGDSGLKTGGTGTSIQDNTKGWSTDEWAGWGIRFGTRDWQQSDESHDYVRTIVSNNSNTLTLDTGSLDLASNYTTYSIEYYAGRGATKSESTVTDASKDFNRYLPSLVGYTVVILEDCTSIFNPTVDWVAKGTVVSGTATSFTVDSWTALYGTPPDNATIAYYFSATGKAMMCSDCHSNDTISSSAATGPHGSSEKWMLKGRNRAWPSTSASENGTGTGTLFTVHYGSSARRTVNDGTPDGLFCLNCHSTVSFSKDAAGLQTPSNLHLLHNVPCVNCHVMVPHGSKRSRLIGDRSDMAARYAFNNDLSNMYITYYQKNFDSNHTGRTGDPAAYTPATNFCSCHYYH
jgi:hypothetical protein